MWNKYLVHYEVAVYLGWDDGENIYVSQEKQLLSTPMKLGVVLVVNKLKF